MTYTDFDVDGIDVRSVAASWHGGQWSDLYAFTSTGHISSTLDTEVERCLRDFNSDPLRYADSEAAIDGMREELEALLAYVTQPIISVWSQYGHNFSDSGNGYETCDRCGAEYELRRDNGADPSHGAYQASNGDEPTHCTGDTSMQHGHPGETGHSLDCEDGCEHCQHDCNCVLCA